MIRSSNGCTILALSAALSLVAPSAVSAHPHVLVTARAEIVFDDNGAVSAVRNIWQFDEAFSAYAIQGLDADGDGALTRDELQPLAQTNVESLEVYDFFTWLKMAGIQLQLMPPEEYWLDIYGSRLTLFYTLPLASPLVPPGDLVLEVTDPEYFVAFTFDEVEPAVLINAPESCVASHRGPAELDAETEQRLAAIPADQELPPDLAALVDTAGISNTIRLRC